MSIYGKLLHIYNSCMRNGQLAKLVLETTDGQERFTFSSQEPAHGLAAGYPHSGITGPLEITTGLLVKPPNLQLESPNLQIEPPNL